MNRIEDVLLKVRQNTEDVLLFSSVLGKDSTLLTHYCCEHFRSVTAVFLYGVQGMRHIERMKDYFTRRYSNLKYIDLPHFAITSYIKTGYLGVKKNPKQKLHNLADMDRMAREMTGLKWSVYGMKKTDSMNRRLQLNTYEGGICQASQKAYPLADYKNGHILTLIEHLDLPRPPVFGLGQSSGEDPSNPSYLLWLYKTWPEDLELTIRAYPGAKAILFEALHYEGELDAHKGL